MVLDETLIKDLRDYIKIKTGKYYFKNIRRLPDNILLTCPFHKDGQENKPSATIRVTEGENTYIGNFHCFTCGASMSISEMVKQILGPIYDEQEVENRFELRSILIRSDIIKQNELLLFNIPEEIKPVKESTLRQYRQYSSYLKQRGINEDTAKVYDIGYDEYSKDITFPIRDINRKCLGIGRRNTERKIYQYPTNFIKPLYGIYELPNVFNSLWIR